MKAFSTGLTWAFALISATGCTVAPKVEYTKITQASDKTDKMFDTFSLQRTNIKVSVSKITEKKEENPAEEKIKDVKDAKAKEKPNAEEKSADAKPKVQKTKADDKPVIDPKSMTATVMLAEFEEFKIGLSHADSWGIKTNLNLTKVENTDLILEAGTEVIDNRQSYIEKGFGLLTSIAKIVPFATSSEPDFNAFPKIINTYAILTSNNVGMGKSAEFDADDGIFVSFGHLPKDSKPIGELPTGATSSLVYSACRTATIKSTMKDYKFEKTVKVSDPRYFQSVGLPLKGKIAMHSECGASVTTEKDNGIKSSVDIANTVVTQYTAFKKALDEKEKEEMKK